MSSASAGPRTERAALPLRPPGPDPRLERLVGVRSPKPTFYAAWREKSKRLDHTIETLQEISAALCTTTHGPRALCEAVVDAAAHHFAAPWAAMSFAREELPPVVADRCARTRRPPPELAPLAARALAERQPVVARGDEEADGDAPASVVVPMLLGSAAAGTLAVGLPPGASLEEGDLAILATLANQAGVALHNARVFQESERLRVRWETASRTAERHAAELELRNRELERTRRQLEEAGRRQLLSQERNRIARELHDSVAQHVLSIGMSLEWCRQHESTSSPVLERISAAKELARDAVTEIRAVIFELASDGQKDLRSALSELVDEVEAAAGLRVSLRTYGAARPLTGEAQHALLQVACEALFNVVRHANAERAWLTVRWQAGGVRLVVADDGNGAPEALQRRLRRARPSGHHRGLANIGERMLALRGSARFERRRGGGVKLTVEVPLGGAVGGSP